MSDKWKTWVWTIIALFLLVIIIDGTTLVGGRGEKELVEKVFHTKSAKKAHQTVKLNNEEVVMGFYMTTNSASSTVLYDHNHGFIAFRCTITKNCYIVNIDEPNVPAMSDILKSIKQYQEQNIISNIDLSYNLLPEEKANKRKGIKIWCNDVHIFWATLNISTHLCMSPAKKKIFGFKQFNIKLEDPDYD